MERTKRVRELKSRLSGLLDLWYYMKEYAETELWQRYNSLFGDLEDKLFEKELELAQMELFDSKSDLQKRGEILDAFSFEFDNENTSNSFGHVSTASVIEERGESLINTIYRELVKVLHPDVCKEKKLSQTYWHQVNDAKQKNDLERLRTYKEIISPSNNSDVEEIISLERKIKIYEEKIAKLKRTEPFSFETLLENKIWVESKRSRLLNQILLADIRLTQKRRLHSCYCASKAS